MKCMTAKEQQHGTSHRFTTLERRGRGRGRGRERENE
jgi:hypothetical protein